MKRRSGYISTGRLQNACSYYEKVLQLQPTDKGVEGKLEKLRREREQVEEIPRGEEAQDTGGISIGRRTSLGMGENIEAFLCYFFPVWFPFLVLLLEKESTFVRFHAIQSLLLYVATFVMWRSLGIIPFITGSALFNFIILGLLGVISLWLMWGALEGRVYKIPWIGDLAEGWARI